MNFLLLLVGTASGFFHSLYSAASKLALKDGSATPLLFLFYINVFQAALTPLLWLFVRPTVPVAACWPPLLAAGATCAVAYVFLYLSLSCGDVSSVMPVMGSKVVFAGLLAAAMLGEFHRWPIYVAAVLVAVAIAMLSYSPSTPGAARFPPKPLALMLACCLIFSLTDIYITRSLQHLDAYNFMVYYNFMAGLAALPLIPWLRRRRTSLRLAPGGLWLTLLSAVCLVAATLLFVAAVRMAQGVVVPNILMSTRGIFIVLISFALARSGQAALDRQGRGVFLLRLAASGLILLSVWFALTKATD